MLCQKKMFHILSSPRFQIYNSFHYLTCLFINTNRFYNQKINNFENNRQIFDFSELNSLSRRSLQNLAKKYKIKANASNDYIRQELARHYCNNANKLMYEESQFTKTMSNEQLGVLKYALQGESFFFSGSAGTGKSYLLREIVRQLKNKHGQDKVYVTSSTGVAACNVGGCTLHSFAGIGIGALDFEQLEESVKKKRYVVERWKRAQVLIVDEVSMLDGDTFEKIEFLARKIRKSELPFGGLQVIFCGDFLQLPPVAPRGSDVRFAFESEAWNRVVKKTFVLHQPFRQKNPEFVKVLNEIRVGKVTSDGIELLKTCADREFPDTEIKPTKLYPHRHAVQIENNKNLQELKGELRVYTATDSGEEPFLSQIKRHCCAPQVLEIKKDAQVILLKNLDIENKLVNGSRGVVIGFDFNGYPSTLKHERAIF